jgi:hypothetical protein
MRDHAYLARPAVPAMAARWNIGYYAYHCIYFGPGIRF